jgi:hypothetical protein
MGLPSPNLEPASMDIPLHGDAKVTFDFTEKGSDPLRNL